MPVKMSKPQAVVMGEKVYLGGGDTESVDDYYQVFQYDSSRNEWSSLPSHQVVWFAMAQFEGNLITVGGRMHDVTGKVYRFNERSKKWEEFFKSMPTARFCPSIATTQSAIVASGGCTGFRDDNPVLCATVEVYNSETSQWYTADPLPVPCGAMTSVTIADTWYLLGGIGADNKAIPNVLHTPLTILIQKATSPFRTSAIHSSVWKTLPDTPLMESAAASLNTNLLAVGGWDDKILPCPGASPAVNGLLSHTNSWVRVTTGNLPEPRNHCTAVQLSSNQVLVVGGYDNQDKHTNTVFLGSITI